VLQMRTQVLDERLGDTFVTGIQTSGLNLKVGSRRRLKHPDFYALPSIPRTVTVGNGNKFRLSAVSPYKRARELAALKWIDSQERICLLATSRKH
jgi:hypothetical protein